MSKKFVAILIVLLCAVCQAGYGQTADELVARAEALNRSGDLEGAARVMEEGIERFPGNSTLHSYLGFYRGMQAGQTQDYMEAGRLIEVAYDMLDKAVELDADNPIARFHRGLMGVKVPAFLGRLNEGIQDLELLAKLHQASPQRVPSALMARGFDFLAEGYQQKKDVEKAVASWKKVIELAPGTDLAGGAEQKIAQITRPAPPEKVEETKSTSVEVEQLQARLKAEPGNPALLTALGKAHLDAGEYESARTALKKAIEADPTALDAYGYLNEALSRMAARGYDERIYDDQEWRTNLAFEVAEYAEKAVEIAPGNPELRLRRGMIDVMMPFFVGKMEQGIADLNFIVEGNAPDQLKAEALYWLGFAHQKKATTYWIKVISEYPGSGASGEAFRSMRPAVQHLDPARYKIPFLAIDFVLGFRDELPPQSAVWIEDKDGGFVKTVYVSGFSGYAKEKQANLGEWAGASGFSDADAVAGASIDAGHHILVWDLKDSKGVPVKAGDYIVRVEAAYWPSMEYQSASATIKVGAGQSRVVVEEGNVIPYLEVTYHAAK